MDYRNRFRIVDNTEAEKLLGNKFSNDFPNDLSGVIIEYTNDGSIEYIAQDGGEPEDQTLFRDWKWVVGALNYAHNNERFLRFCDSWLAIGLRAAMDMYQC